MRLYVGNLPFKANESDLESFFSQAGVSVNQISIMRDKFSGEARGFGFVDVPDSDGETVVRSCNGKEFMGRALVINEARPMSPGGAGAAIEPVPVVVAIAAAASAVDGVKGPVAVAADGIAARVTSW